jgi:putative membrane protein
MRRMRFLLTSIITAVAVWFTTVLPFDVAVVGGEEEWWRRALVFLGIGALMAALNAFVKPVVDALTLPVKILTLGLFSLVIGWFILWLASWITENVPVIKNWATLEIGGFWNTLFAALVIAISVAILSAIIPGAKRD